MTFKLPCLMPFLKYLIHWCKKWFYYLLPTQPFYRSRKHLHDICSMLDKCGEVEPQHASLLAVAYARRKPLWVIDEVLRLKALMGKAGCRSVATTFNRLHGHGVKPAFVGKTFVAETIRRNQYQLHCIQRDIRNCTPRPLPIHAIWGMDLSFYHQVKTQDHLAQYQDTKQHSMLGIIDHGSRAIMQLTAITNKRAWTLLGYLCLAIGKYGKPKAIRTDNENIFNSFVFRTFLWLTGIRHQQTQVCAPWQNGRIERLFGTLKPLLKQLVIPNGGTLQMALHQFTLFYNHVRPHQHLQGLTPAEVWRGMTVVDLKKKRKCKPVLVKALGGLLVGFYLRR